MSFFARANFTFLLAVQRYVSQKKDVSQEK